ncbi:MAG: glutamine synthetase type III [Deltaproteobacteria bacterium]|nr:MAG: glutamine synthetase type III [Deltaproteobacteria bacterium]
MPTIETRNNAKIESINRINREIDIPLDLEGNPMKVSDFYGENLFNVATSTDIPEVVRKEIIEVTCSGKRISKDHADVVANAVTKWATEKGATHFCHWFQPLTGGTAEKHDAFLTIKDGRPIEKLSVSQLLQGEPDASSFPNGGARSTFEARGYTSWDLTSPMFITEGPNGKTLCIPTAFVSYTGEALDIKTPLLRSISKLSKEATRFLNLVGSPDVTRVDTTIGCEQEYFLIDKDFYYARPDLVMTGRTLMGSSAAKNQQLDDHYFGRIPDRVMGFMQELDQELYRLGIPAKTRHNEVAPGQYEIAPIFDVANVAADQNQLLMATIRAVAAKHDFVAILHEKPFAGINGSGKHVNWSMSDSKGNNLLEPGQNPHQNLQFLATVAIVTEAVFRHATALRMGIASAGNDHRLGANEAPPSIISVFLGHTIEKIFDAINQGKEFTGNDGDTFLETGAQQLAHLMLDNTDRNRTSPFAFTGNKFEFRAVGSTAAVGFPVSILNAAVADVYKESADFVESEIKAGASADQALMKLTTKWVKNAYNVIFNGDGYSEEWVKEAEKRGLPNLRNSAEALKVLKNPSESAFLTETGVYKRSELDLRYEVLAERYNTHREIEFKTLLGLVNQSVIPSAIDYKQQLGEVIARQKSINLECSVETEIYKKLNFAMESLYANVCNLTTAIQGLKGTTEEISDRIANDLFPQSEVIANFCAEIESIIPDDLWTLPKFQEMLFLR